MTKDGVTSLLRIFENGEYHYRFECPFCGVPAMHLKSYSPVTEARGHERVVDINFVLTCSVCGRSKVVRNMPISRGLGQA